MLQALYTPGTRVNFHGLAAITTPLPDQYLSLSFVDVERAPSILSEAEVQAQFGKTLHLMSKRVPETQQLNLTLEEHLEVERRNAYIKELARVSTKGGCGGVKLRQAVIDRVSREIKDVIKVSPAHLARWYKKAQEHSQGVAATLPAKTKVRRSSFPQDVKDLAIRAVDQYYLLRSRPTVQFAYDCFVQDVDELLGTDAPRPCYATFSKWIANSFNPMDVTAARNGQKALRAAKRKSLQKLIVDRIHERAEADAVHLGIGLIDDQGNYLGTVTLFAVIDCYSRAITGIQIQIGRGESSASVIDSFRHAISIKEPGSYSHEAVHDWPMYGSPEVFVTDGGSGYTALKTISFCLDAESQVQVVETGKGWKKPYIESFFATLRLTFARSLGCYCGKYADQRELDRTIQEQACMTPAQFESALTHWIVDEYHQSQHTGLEGKTPYDAWKQGAIDFPPSLPANYSRIAYTKGETLNRTIQGDNGHQGITVNNVYYNDAEGQLKEIYMRLKGMGKDAVVACEYSPNDISSINAVNPFTEEVFEVETHDQRIFDGMSLAEFQAAHPTTKKNKGFGRKRVARNSKVLKDANERHNAKMKHKPKKSTVAKTDEITAEVHQRRSNHSPRVEDDSSIESTTANHEPEHTYDRNEDFGYE